MFKKKIKDPPGDLESITDGWAKADTYGEGLLIRTCKVMQLTLIKEHFADEIRYLVKDGDITVHDGVWWDHPYLVAAANRANWRVMQWAKENRIGITVEVLSEPVQEEKEPSSGAFRS